MRNSKGGYKGLALVRDVGHSKKHRGTMVTEHGVDEFGNGVALVVLHAKTDKWSDLIAGYDAMGSTTVHQDHIIEWLEEDITFTESAVLRVSEFYYQWKKQDRFICPVCRSSFLFDLDGANGKCHGCANIAEGKPAASWLWNREFTDIELTDDMVLQYNQKVIIKMFTNIFKQFMNRCEDAYISQNAPEYLMDHGHKMGKIYASYLTTNQLQELRDVFKEAYIHACTETRKRYGRQF